MVSDPDAGPVTCPRTELAPGESMTCSVPSHVITAADAKAGRVTNVATATGRTDDGTPITSDPARASIEVKSVGLPVTRGDLGRLLAIGAALVALGGLLALASLHRTRRRAS